MKPGDLREKTRDMDVDQEALDCAIYREKNVQNIIRKPPKRSNLAYASLFPGENWR